MQYLVDVWVAYLSKLKITNDIFINNGQQALMLV